MRPTRVLILHNELTLPPDHPDADSEHEITYTVEEVTKALEGAGYRSAEAVAAADAEKLCADLMAFATTPAGQRVLKSGEVPDIERIKAWLEAARSVRAA